MPFLKKSLATPQTLNLLWITLGFIFALSFFSLTAFGLKRGYYSLIIFGGIILSLYYSSYKQKYQEQLTQIFCGVLICLIFIFIYSVALTYLNIPQWDFLCLYLFGKVGISGSNFYDPAVFAQFFHELQLRDITNDVYVREIVNVGFWYPPSSMFIFLPLGLFTVKTGYIIWQTVISIFLVVDIILLINSWPWQQNVQQRT